jgi:thiosulfate reductase cytochrome b subunit
MSPSHSPPETIFRHSLLVRITHWVNAATLIILLMSGLNIFNAHPSLYWGKQSTFDRPALTMTYVQGKDGGYAGVTRIGGAEFTTTGVLGLSRHDGRLEARGFPSWATIPSGGDLATARHWHFFFAWVLVLNGLLYVGNAVLTGHVRQDLWTAPHAFREIPGEIWNHLRLKFPRGEEARSYSVLQRLSYFGVIFILGPLIVLTGLSMSPGVNASLGGILPDMFGGRQSARTIHFICAALFVLFIVVHLLMVLVSGVGNNLRSMITGRYVLPPPKPTPETGP